MPKAKSAILLLAAVGLFVLGGCGGGGPTNLSGNWQVTINESPPFSVPIELNQTGNQFSGMVTAAGWQNSKILGTVTGNSLQATLTENCLLMSLTGTVDGNLMSGSYLTEPTGCEGGGLSGTWSASRVSE
jgi:hypothetical protein